MTLSFLCKSNICTSSFIKCQRDNVFELEHNNKEKNDKDAVGGITSVDKPQEEGFQFLKSYRQTQKT